MNILIPPKEEQKLCHAPPGTVVEIGEEIWLVAFGKNVTAAQLTHSSAKGLYELGEDCYFVNLRTGEIKQNIRHLSAKVMIHRNATLLLGAINHE